VEALQPVAAGCNMVKDDSSKRGKRHKKQQQQAAGDETPAMAPEALPDRLRDQHRFVSCGPDLNMHVRPPCACPLVAPHILHCPNLAQLNSICVKSAVRPAL
jgi:hypothetical protein